MRILKASDSMFASNPLGVIKKPMKMDANNKFGYIQNYNASGVDNTRIVSSASFPKPPLNTSSTITPSTSSPNPPSNNGIPTSGGSFPSPPADLPSAPDTTANDSTNSGVDTGAKVESSECYVSYLIAGAIGGGIGYVISEKKNKNIYGGMLLGAGSLAGLAYLYCHKDEIVAKFSGK